MPLRITDAVDMHCHFGPDTIGGTLEPWPDHGVTGLQAARDAAASGHAALVLKSHSFASPSLASALEEMVPDLRVFGGICTDYPSGGLNVEAVESALALGARIVWLPTLHSHQDFLNGAPFNYIGEGIEVIDDTAEPLPVVHQIFELVRQKDAILATGHITAAEHYAIAKTFARRGKVLVTHAGEELAGPRLDVAQCTELADLGAFIELTALSCRDIRGVRGKKPDEMAQMIRAIGPARCTLSTDYGWTTALPHPAAGLREFLEELWHVGITEDELATMVSTNPARLLDLPVDN